MVILYVSLVTYTLLRDFLANGLVQMLAHKVSIEKYLFFFGI